MKKRSADGRFISENSNIEENFSSDIRGFLRLSYRLWRYLPLLILLLLLWKYFKISLKIQDTLMELTCGTGCSCNCDAPQSKNGF